MLEQNERFEGYALLELMGHRKECGHVVTKYFGPSAFFEVSMPEIPPAVVTLAAPQRVKWEDLPAGSKIRVQRRKKLIYVAVGSLYAFHPCTEAEAEEFNKATVEVVERATVPLELAPAPNCDDLFEPADPEDESMETDQMDMPGGYPGEISVRI